MQINNSGLNFSASDLEKLVNDTKRIKEDANEQKMLKFTQIVKGVARKYAYGVSWIEQDDLEQDLWVKVLTLIEDCGGIENVDEKLVANVCWNKAVDSYRYSRRRWDSKAQYIEGSDNNLEMDNWDNMSKGMEDYFDALHSDKFIKAVDLILFKEVIDLFEVGSRERKYVVLKLVNGGVLDISHLDPWDRALVAIPDEETEAGYIHLLGYKSHCPGSWTCKKREIERVIKEFLGGQYLQD